MEVKFSIVLRRHLAKGNETSASLAKKLGLSKSIVHGWVQGAVPTGKHLDKIFKLSGMFGISLVELLFDVQESAEKETLFTSCFRDSGQEYLVKVEKRRQKGKINSS